MKLNRKNLWLKAFFLISGMLATIWFLIRVIPKPSRAAYPCQRAAFPIASSFVLWILASTGTFLVTKRTLKAFSKGRYFKTFFYALSGLLLFAITVVSFHSNRGIASVFSSQEVPEVKTFHEEILEELPVTVGIARSGKLKASDLNYLNIESLVREAVALAGGLEGIISDGQTVMLKPNLVNDKGHAVTVNGVTTDYRVIQAVSTIVRELNPHGKIILAEGSAGSATTVTNMERLKYTTIDNIDEFIGFEASSGGYRQYNSELLQQLDLPDSLSLYPDNLKPNKSRTLYYNKAYFNADVLISIPVLKNHQNAGITGGVKNVSIGATPANIYGDKDKTRPFLRSNVIDHYNGNLELWIHDYYAGRPVDFVIMDGLQGVSSGPGGADLSKNQHNMRLILAGKDAIATDAIAGLIMGHDPQIAPYLIHLHNHKFGIVDPALIEVNGIQVFEVREDFGFDREYTTQTKFDKFQSSDYALSATIENNLLRCSVHNSMDLARMQIWLDGQKLEKYIVGGFSDIQINLEEIEITQGNIEVLFEDRYLNILQKQFQAVIVPTDVFKASYTDVKAFPNPCRDNLFLEWQNENMQNFTVEIFDFKGAKVYAERISGNAGLNIHNLDVSELMEGQYILSIMADNGICKRTSFIRK